MQSLSPDYIFGIHFPYIVPAEVLRIPNHGALNLHPAFLPYNRGWHTPSWAILENTPYGATLHFMSERLDAGDIVHQEVLEVLPEDTADTLYQRVKELEMKVFCEAWPSLMSFSYRRIAQRQDEGTSHVRKDLLLPEVQAINLNESIRAGSLLDKLRALTTSSIDEAAYFEIDGNRYHVQVRIVAK